MDASELARRGPEVWVDDLYWHRKMHQPSQAQWGPEQVMQLVTRQTAGRLEFTTVRDLAELEEHRHQLIAVAQELELAVYDRIVRCMQCGFDRDQVVAELQLTSADTAVLVDMDTWWPREPHPHAAVRIALRDVRAIAISNPLIEAWELKQVRGMWRAASRVADDAVCDLVVELMDAGHPAEELRRALWEPGVPWMLRRISRARAERGLANDPRRRPLQRF